MSLYLIADTVIAVLFLLLAYFTISSKNTRTRQGRVFVALTFAFLIWMITNHISNDSSVSEPIAIVATRILFAASFMATVLTLVFTKEITGKKILSVSRGGVLFVAILAILFASPLLVESIYKDGAVYGITFGPLWLVYGLALAVLVTLMIVTVVGNWNSKKATVRRQVRAAGVGVIVAAPLILLLGFIIPNATTSFEISRVALAPSVIMVGMIYYATIRHGLFDLRSVAIRTMTYVLTLSVLTAVYFLLAYILSIILFKGHASTGGLSISPLNVVLALVMAIIFQPIKRLFDKLTNDIFYRSSYDPEQFLKEFSRIISYNTDINLLVDSARDYLVQTLKASTVEFYIIDRDSLNVKGKSVARLSTGTLNAIIESIPDNHEEIIQTNHLDQGRLSKILSHHKIKIVIPMRHNSQLIGYIFLGEHRTGSYDLRDIRMLDSIINELVIAIQNSLSVEVIRDLNENLQQKVDDATRELRKSNEKLKQLDKTKDEFLSIASHQLRTPLTSVKGYIDMIREGDFGPVNTAQKNALDETFSSSERMVRLINDFLNVSRLQTGKFTIEKRSSDFGELIRQEIGMLDLVAKQSGIKLDASIDDAKDVQMDVEKIRQVILNMIDNAIFYSKSNSTVKIRLKKTRDWVEFTVKDTGIGVPKAEQERLFGKFFRAENARKRRPDGTGVGLFLSKKVVTGHKGEIVFESEEGKGSVFGFRLPL